MLNAYLQRHYVGWENNDGGYGDFKWEVALDHLYLEHTTYVMEEHKHKELAL
jgi:hypothetical protein